MLRRTAAVLLALIVVAPAASCGSRTGLEVDPALVDGDAGTVGCTSGTFSLTRADPTLMFAIDRSGSMGEALGTTNGGSTRWQILTNALSASLPSVDDAMEIGALLFPSGGSQRELSCAVAPTADITPALHNVSALLTLMHTRSPGGATPTATAIDVAASRLLDVRAASKARAIVLATDGAPNCNAGLDAATCRCATANQTCRSGAMCLDDASTVAKIGSYARSGLPTYVIGIQATDDTTFNDVLDAMAVAGGRPQATGAHRFYAAASEADLTSALIAIRDQIGSCTYLTTSVPNDGGTITILVDGSVVAFDPSGIEGWTWGSKKNGEIVLVGSACSKATGDVRPGLTANVMCALPDAGNDADGSD